MKKSVLRKYATLIATVGVNVQKGQEVFIAAELDQPEFVKMVVEECYRRCQARCGGLGLSAADEAPCPLAQPEEPLYAGKLGGGPLAALC